MQKKELVDYLKRWQKVNDRQIAEWRQTPFRVRFAQAAALMQFAKSLGGGKKPEKEGGVRDRWKRLKEAIR